MPRLDLEEHTQAEPSERQSERHWHRSRGGSLQRVVRERELELDLALEESPILELDLALDLTQPAIGVQAELRQFGLPFRRHCAWLDAAAEGPEHRSHLSARGARGDGAGSGA